MAVKKSKKAKVNRTKAKDLSPKRKKLLDKALKKWTGAQGRNNELLDI